MRTLLCLAALVVSNVAQAQSGALLAEIAWHQPFQVTLPSNYTIFTELEPGGVNAGWLENVSQFPHQSFADPAMVDRFNRVLAAGDELQFIRYWNGGDQGQHAVEGGGLGCQTCFVHRLIGDERDEWLDRATAAGWVAQMIAPPQGPGLFGYLITDVERLVTANAQTIRFYGVTVPEPSTWLLVLFALVAHVSKRSPR